MNPGERVQAVGRTRSRSRERVHALPLDGDDTPEGDPYEMRSDVQCAPATSGFVVCVATLIPEEQRLRRALDEGQVCGMVSACTQAQAIASLVCGACTLQASITRQNALPVPCAVWCTM